MALLMKAITIFREQDMQTTLQKWRYHYNSCPHFSTKVSFMATKKKTARKKSKPKAKKHGRKCSCC